MLSGNNNQRDWSETLIEWEAELKALKARKASLGIGTDEPPINGTAIVPTHQPGVIEGTATVVPEPTPKRNARSGQR